MGAMGSDSAATLTVLLVRHAAAEDRDARRWPDDTDRPLTARGAERFRRLCDSIRGGVPSIDVLLSSRYARAWSTAEIIAESLHAPAPERCEALEEQGPAVLREALRDAARPGVDVIAMVGHEPWLSAFAATLLGDGAGVGTGDRPRLRFRKGAIVAISLDVLPRSGDGTDASGVLGDATLEWMVHPRLVGRPET